MLRKKLFVNSLTITLIAFTLVLISFFAITPAQALAPNQGVDNGTCINCHEDLYFNHDTGRWFCLRESPMSCVSCHGGNPRATTKDDAHYDRSAHPVINEDISRCQECHVNPDECCERVTKFSRVAGIKEVKLASTVAVVPASDQNPSLPSVEEQESVNLILILEILMPTLIVILALAIYIARKARHV